MENRFVVFNNFGIGEPDDFKVFEDADKANSFMQEQGEEWDITDYNTFKSWYPHLLK